MIGVNTSIFKSAGRKLVNLLGTLKNRATYYENGTDSTAEKNRIESLGILDDATILLTPTAISDARVHSVKTYTGDELVSGGTFTTQSDVDLWTGYNDGVLSLSNSRLLVTPSSSNSGRATQGITTVVGHTYILSLNFENPDSSNVLVGFSNNANGSGATYTTSTSVSGSFNFYYTATATTTYISLSRLANDTKPIYYDNVSVVDVSSDFDFDRASSATRINSDGLVQDMQSITDPELVLNGDFEELGDELVTNGDFATDSDWIKQTGWSISNGKAISDGSGNYKSISQSCLVSPIGKTYKVTYEVSDYVIGEVRCILGGFTLGQIISSNGLVTEYLTVSNASSNTFVYLETRGSGFTGSIDNISVQQVDPNDRWTVGATWSLGDGVANYEGGSNSAIIQNITLTSGNTYNIKFTVSNASGNASIWIGDGAGGVNYFGGTYAPYANGSYDLYFTMPSNQTTLAFYGASSGSNFSIDNISLKDVTFSTDVDLARINYDSNGENGHILLEPSSTNLVTYSEDFNEWTLTRCSLGDKVLSPNGTISAYKIIPNTENAKHEISTSVSSYTTATVSLFAKAAEKHRLQITKSNWGTTDFDLLNETVTSGVGTIESYGNGWYRCTASYTASPSQSTIYIIVADDDGDVTYSGNNSDGIYFWGAQLEALPYATSYIPTLTGSTVTRAGEKLYGSGNSTLINSEEGVLYAEIAALADDTTYRFISLSDGTTGNRVVLGYHNVSNTVRGYVYSGTTIVATMSYAVDSIRDFIKLAIKYKRDDFALWVDGVKRGVDGAGAAPIGLDSLQFHSGDGSSLLYGKCKAVAVFDRALNDTELGNLTNNS